MCVASPDAEGTTEALQAVIRALSQYRAPLVEDDSDGVFEDLRASLALKVHPDTKRLVQKAAMRAVPTDKMGAILLCNLLLIYEVTESTASYNLIAFQELGSH